MIASPRSACRPVHRSYDRTATDENFGRHFESVAHVQRDIDVLLMYWTVSPTTSGRMQFHPDIYQLDAAALAALGAPVRVTDISGG